MAAIAKNLAGLLAVFFALIGKAFKPPFKTLVPKSNHGYDPVFQNNPIDNSVFMGRKSRRMKGCPRSRMG